jgi:hypothetical protein
MPVSRGLFNYMITIAAGKKKPAPGPKDLVPAESLIRQKL